MITVETNVIADLETVWDFWTSADHIKNWYHASPDWHVLNAENELSVAGQFKIVMAAKDGSFQFDFEGEYTKIVQYEFIEYHLIDGRKVSIQFSPEEDSIHITEIFEPENTNSLVVQKAGWQAILDNFKSYTEQK